MAAFLNKQEWWTYLCNCYLMSISQACTFDEAHKIDEYYRNKDANKMVALLDAIPDIVVRESVLPYFQEVVRIQKQRMADASFVYNSEEVKDKDNCFGRYSLPFGSFSSSESNVIYKRQMSAPEPDFCIHITYQQYRQLWILFQKQDGRFDVDGCYVPSDIAANGNCFPKCIEICVTITKEEGIPDACVGKKYSFFVRMGIVNMAEEFMTNGLSDSPIQHVGFLDFPLLNPDENKGASLLFGTLPGFPYFLITDYPILYNMDKSDGMEIAYKTNGGQFSEVASMHLQMWYVLMRCYQNEVLQPILLQNKQVIKDRRKYISGIKTEKAVRKLPVYTVTDDVLHELQVQSEGL